MKKILGNKKNITIIILTILLLCLSGYFIYEKLSNRQNEKTNEPEKSQKEIAKDTIVKFLIDKGFQSNVTGKGKNVYEHCSIEWTENEFKQKSCDGENYNYGIINLDDLSCAFTYRTSGISFTEEKYDYKNDYASLDEARFNNGKWTDLIQASLDFKSGSYLCDSWSNSCVPYRDSLIEVKNLFLSFFEKAEVNIELLK